ncbi:MAG: YebC/PmpR family DNA-binding transcriptional regulator [Chloroflexi bacterium]|nr:YebC/PmpR family DNA-binding transcriptional regulator [Chloroflexota bacterium]
MSGHSKWSTIKRKKGVTDARRGQLFTKLAREIEMAARQGGGDPSANFSLRLAMEKARKSNMPKDNVQRAIKRGTGELKGEALEEAYYEAHGPHGTGLMIQVVTDNRNRTVADMRRVVRRHNSHLGESGSVSWQFTQKGVITIEAGSGDTEELALTAIDSGADDVRIEDDVVEVYTELQDFQRVQEQLVENNIPIAEAEIELVPQNLLTLEESETLKMMRMVEELEDLDDVQRVFTNIDIPDELMGKLE